MSWQPACVSWQEGSAASASASAGEVVRPMRTSVSHTRSFQASTSGAAEQALLVALAGAAAGVRAVDEDLVQGRFHARAFRDGPRLGRGLPRQPEAAGQNASRLSSGVVEAAQGGAARRRHGNSPATAGAPGRTIGHGGLAGVRLRLWRWEFRSRCGFARRHGCTPRRIGRWRNFARARSSTGLWHDNVGKSRRCDCG